MEGGRERESPGRRGVAWAIRKPKGLFGTQHKKSKDSSL